MRPANYANINFNKMRTDNSHLILEKSVRPHFDNLENHLINYINQSTYVIGCVAWLTNRNIIDALENIKGVKIIINKEEYLNSNMQTAQKFTYKCLRGCYNSIPDLFTIDCDCCKSNIVNCNNFNKIFGSIVNDIAPPIIVNSVSITPVGDTRLDRVSITPVGDTRLDRVSGAPVCDTRLDRVASIVAKLDGDTVECETISKNGAIITCGIVNNYSKMHHKFLVFFNEAFEPIGVWTGSYNLSITSNFSLENALYITDADVIAEYIKEFLIIYSFSESYNWNSGLLSVGI